jgi:hypothetical protein
MIRYPERFANHRKAIELRSVRHALPLRASAALKPKVTLLVTRSTHASHPCGSWEELPSFRLRETQTDQTRRRGPQHVDRCAQRGGVTFALQLGGEPQAPDSNSGPRLYGVGNDLCAERDAFITDENAR